MICKGCGQSKKLVKAHIIPESFFKAMKSGSSPLKILSNTKGVHSKKSHIGIYDKSILCRECEDKFQTLDDYGYRALLGAECQQTPLIDNEKIVGYEFSGVDGDKLKLFFISILWRASISTHSFYSKVKLGKLEGLAKQHVWNFDAGDEDDFSFVLAKFEGDLTAKTIMDPHPEVWEGVDYQRFYLGSYILYIKVDEKKTPESWRPFIANSGKLFVVSRGPIEKSKEFKLLTETVGMQKT
ncbi:hypothetical protein [Vibrio harveyi]|uniref:hypothetical protein n=1 Tax=Vibrio harveyi TaxID=669 RepID=UPI00390B28AD